MVVFLDMVGVGLFVPLLSYYWKDLGVRPELLGVVQSTYQLSQIASGVAVTSDGKRANTSLHDGHVVLAGWLPCVHATFRSQR